MTAVSHKQISDEVSDCLLLLLLLLLLKMMMMM